MSTAPAFASAREALAMVHAGLGYLTGADPTEMAAEVQAECLRALEQADAMATAARAWVLGAFASGQGYSADADYSPRAWLVHKTGVTRGAAAGHVGWARRATAHPQVAVALAEGAVLTESMARTVCGWTDKLPQDCQQAADEILIAAARAGADQRTLAELAAEIYVRFLPEPDGGPDDGFDDRSVRVETTFGGAGIIRGDLTPECAALVSAVLDCLSAPRGAQDTRTREQRYHDGLHEAMDRLIAAGLLPERAGQPVKAWAHVSVAELLAMDGGSALAGEWIAAVRARWAAARAASSVSGGDGAAWLDGAAAHAVTCDASLIPVVTGQADTTVLDDLVSLCVQLAGHHACRGFGQADGPPGEQAPPAQQGPALGGGRAPGGGCGTGPLTAQAREMLEHAIIGKAVDLVSGPGGLASFLRRGLLDARLAGPSLPLDVGQSTNIPAAIRRAVTLRDQHCRWPGGCAQPAAVCEVHHVRHKADGGLTSVKDCILLCTFHHQVVIHRWGWKLLLNPDGTSTARSPDGTKLLRSHAPPPRPGL